MKEKLLLLIEACIKDESMYNHTYENGSYRGINERKRLPRTSFVSLVQYNGKNVYGIKEYVVDIKPYHTQTDGLELTIGFGKEPLLTIRPILKGNNNSRPTEVIKVRGYIDKWWGKPWVDYDVTVIREEYHYELRCGKFAYIIDESVVKGFIDQIAEKRIQLAYQADLKEINSRLTKYNIDNVI